MEIYNNTSLCYGNLSVLNRHGNWQELYLKYTIKIPFVRVLMIMWFTIGIPGAMFNIVVWLQQKMRDHPSSLYLVFLSSVDLCFLVMQIPFHLNDAWSLKSLDAYIWCEVFPVINYGLQYCGPLITCAFTVERYISVRYPFLSERVCTTDKAIKVCCVLVISSFSLSSVQAYFYRFNFNLNVCDEFDGILHDKNIAWFYTIWNWVTESFVFGCVPFAILLFNILVIKEVQKLHRRPLLNNWHDKSTDNHHHRKQRATTCMLLCVSFHLIISTLPVTCMFILQTHFLEGNLCISEEMLLLDATWKNHFKFISLKTILANLAYSHHALRFFIYFATGRQFRLHFVSRFCGMWGQSIYYRKSLHNLNNGSKFGNSLEAVDSHNLLFVNYCKGAEISQHNGCNDSEELAMYRTDNEATYI